MNAAWTAASEEMYKNTQGAGAQGAQPGADGNGNAGQEPNAGGGENVTDAEFEEVK